MVRSIVWVRAPYSVHSVIKGFLGCLPFRAAARVPWHLRYVSRSRLAKAEARTPPPHHWVMPERPRALLLTCVVSGFPSRRHLAAPGAARQRTVRGSEGAAPASCAVTCPSDGWRGCAPAPTAASRPDTPVWEEPLEGFCCLSVGFPSYSFVGVTYFGYKSFICIRYKYLLTRGLFSTQ